MCVRVCICACVRLCACLCVHVCTCVDPFPGPIISILTQNMVWGTWRSHDGLTTTAKLLQNFLDQPSYLRNMLASLRSSNRIRHLWIHMHKRLTFLPSSAVGWIRENQAKSRWRKEVRMWQCSIWTSACVCRCAFLVVHASQCMCVYVCISPSS